MSLDLEHRTCPVGHMPNPPRKIGRALWRGFRSKCPSCGTGSLFRRYLKVASDCSHCNEALHHHRADDAPPYFTILIVAHLMTPLVLSVEMAMRPDLWVHAVLWLPTTVGLTLLFLAPVKGAVVGLQWALYMHGFDPQGTSDDPPA